MKTLIVAGVLLLALSAVAGSLLAQEGSPAGAEVQWLSDYAAAEKQARETGKPLFVAFRCER